MNTRTIVVIASSTIVATLHADTRSSADYSITTDTIDAGGRGRSSASYTNSASIGGIAGVSTVAAPAETLKAGFIGQLYDATGLTLTVAGTEVNEAATVQLGAWLALDDGTLLVIPATGVAWSVQSGPLTGISGGGVATAGAVYENTGATVQGVHPGFTSTLGLTVVNAVPDNFGAYAGDGLEDGWQAQNFGLNNPQAVPEADPDGDGEINGAEFVALTDPASAASVFRITSAVDSGENLVISFPTVIGRNYTLQSSDSLTGTWTSLEVPAPLAGTGATGSLTVPSGTADHRFFRVQVGP